MVNLSKLFAYDNWANRAVLENLRSIDKPPIRAVQLLSHIIAAQMLWIDRIESRQQTLAVWPELSFDQCDELLSELQGRWAKLLSGADEPGMKRVVSYVNTQGESWSNAVRDILLHVIAHGPYHRGQIATHLRAAGHGPAYTDYIHAVRQGFIE